jgi:hypothetical protein
MAKMVKFECDYRRLVSSPFLRVSDRQGQFQLEMLAITWILYF